MKITVTLKDNGGLTIDTDEGERRIEFAGSPKKEGVALGVADLFEGLKIGPGVTGTITLELKPKPATGYSSVVQRTSGT